MALKGFQKAQSRIDEPMQRGLQALPLARSGRLEEGLAGLQAALAEARRRQEIWCVPGLLRLLAVLPPASNAADLLGQAIETARNNHLPLREQKARADLGRSLHGAAA